MLGRIARGQNIGATAQALAIAPKTDANYVSTIVAKPQVVDRAKAIIRDAERGRGR